MNRRIRGVSIAITVVGLLLFAGLSIGCYLLWNQTEDRLLDQRTNEAASALQASLGNIRSPLDSAAKLARATDGDAMALDSLKELVGENLQYTAVALYRVGDTTPVATLGTVTLPTGGDNGAEGMLRRAAGHPFVVLDLLTGGDRRRLGYAVPDSSTDTKFVVYGERALSVDPNVRRRTDEPFAQLDYAIYLGHGVSNEHLLGSSLRDLPIDGRHAERSVPFGDTEMTLVMTPIGHLAGDLFANLWWIVALFGAAVSLAFGTLGGRLLSRRDRALELAEDNERLYGEQRHIAETLQLSLLPQHLEAPTGIIVAARYWPAGSANLIGGDFYDTFRVDDERWGVLIGDVCGKGVEAAGLTGLVRHTARAAARYSTAPEDLLLAVHRGLAEHRPATFCTACFGYISPLANGRWRLDISLGGHPQPFLVHADRSVEAIGDHGTLLGMIEPTLSSVSIDLSIGDTLVFYTDGLTDAPGAEAVPLDEFVDVLHTSGQLPIEMLADAIRVPKRRRRPHGSGDDTAILILRVVDPL